MMGLKVSSLLLTQASPQHRAAPAVETRLQLCNQTDFLGFGGSAGDSHRQRDSPSHIGS